MKTRLVLAAALTAAVSSVACAPHPQDRTLTITGFGAKSGVVRVFGINSEAAIQAAAEAINEAGGVTLGDGTRARLVVQFLDDGCGEQQAAAIVRHLATTDAFVAVGPTCSNVAESLYGILQKKVDDTSDPGLQFPIFTDVAAKVGLASISEWAFRNAPNDLDMYTALFAWLRKQHPDLKTFYGGVEKNFAHSSATYRLMQEQAEANGFRVLGTAEWLLDDTAFSDQVGAMHQANPDVVAISAHPFTTCGVLREMKRQGVAPKLLIGLTSSSSDETLKICADEAEGLIIPTSFAPVSPEASAAAEHVARFGGSADVHSAATYEVMFILKDVIERQRIMARPDTVQADRRKMRDGLAALESTPGLLGPIGRTSDREAIKPFLYVQAKSGRWVVLHEPAH